MEPAKNLHVNLPTAMVTQLEKTAEAGHTTLDELVEQAVQRFLIEQDWKKLRAYGEQQARKIGVTSEEDVDRVIHEFREEEQRKRQNDERGR